MEKKGADHTASQSGVALVMALVLTAAMLLLIAAVSYFLMSGYRANTVNKGFANAYEAANGGVEYTSGIVTEYLNGNVPANIGSVSLGTGVSALSDIVLSCLPGTATITAKTADAKFNMVATVECAGSKPIPGMGGVLRFPPPAGVTSGGATQLATKYMQYRIAVKVNETTNPQFIGVTEAVYQAAQ